MASQKPNWIKGIVTRSFFYGNGVSKNSGLIRGPRTFYYYRNRNPNLRPGTIVSFSVSPLPVAPGRYPKVVHLRVLGRAPRPDIVRELGIDLQRVEASPMTERETEEFKKFLRRKARRKATRKTNAFRAKMAQATQGCTCNCKDGDWACHHGNYPCTNSTCPSRRKILETK